MICGLVSGIDLEKLSVIITLGMFAVSTLVSCDTLYPSYCPSNFGSSGLPCNFTFLIDLRRVDDFSHLFSFLPLGQSDDFQALCIPYQKLELLASFFS